MDIQFKEIRDRDRVGAMTNVVSRAEHVPEIERFVRVLKERARCYFAMLLEAEIDTLPRTRIIHLMITVNFYINEFVW